MKKQKCIFCPQLKSLLLDLLPYHYKFTERIPLWILERESLFFREAKGYVVLSPTVSVHKNIRSFLSEVPETIMTSSVFITTEALLRQSNLSGEAGGLFHCSCEVAIIPTSQLSSSVTAAYPFLRSLYT